MNVEICDECGTIEERYVSYAELEVLTQYNPMMPQIFP